MKKIGGKWGYIWIVLIPNLYFNVSILVEDKNQIKNDSVESQRIW